MPVSPTCSPTQGLAAATRTHPNPFATTRAQASTAPLQSLSSKLVKSRHCLHATNLQCEAGRSDCDKSKRDVEANDANISALEDEERRLKLAYVESKLAYEKMHALKYARQQELKHARQQKVVVGKESDSLAGAYNAKRYEWTKAHEDHLRVEEAAKALSAKLEAVEKDKDLQRKRAQQYRDEFTKYSAMHESLKRELDVIQASAAAV